MYLYHFQASGFRHGADEFCVDAAAAERIAFEMFLEMSACAKRVVAVTVINSDGTQVLKMRVCRNRTLQICRRRLPTSSSALQNAPGHAGQSPCNNDKYNHDQPKQIDYRFRVLLIHE